MDTTNVLAEVLAQGLEDLAFCGIYDPDAVKVMCDAGVGNEVSLSLGGEARNASSAAPQSSPQPDRSSQADQ